VKLESNMYLKGKFALVTFLVVLAIKMPNTPSRTNHIDKNMSSGVKKLSHPVLEGKPNANHVRARISNSRTPQLHNMDIITQCSNSNIKRGIIVDYIICLRHPHSLYNNQSAEKKRR
jgi:hypothetical protein